MDGNGDGQVSGEELVRWIRHVSEKSAQRAAQERWDLLMGNAGTQDAPVDDITWERYAEFLTKGGAHFSHHCVK